MKQILILASFLMVFSGCQSTGIKSSLNKKKLLNGVELLNFKDANYPNFYVVVWSDEAASTEEYSQSGVTSILGDYLKEGTKLKDKKEILKKLSSMGANISAVTNQEQFYVTANSLVEDSLKLSKLLTEVVLKPSFPKSALKNLVSRQQGYFKKINDSPGSLASRLFTKQMFQNHPYARLTLGDAKALASLKVSDVEERYQQVLDPSHLKVALIGNWASEAETHIISEFSDLNKTERLLDMGSKVTVNEKAKERVFYSKSGQQQAQVKMGVTTIGRSSPDYLPLIVGMKVLGGSFKSLLGEELRVKRGLTYGVGAGVKAYSQGGLILISSAVRHDKLVEFVDVTEKLVADFIKRGITEEELNKMKALYAGEYPRSLETLEQEASLYLSYEALGFSGKEIYKFLNQIERVTKDQVDGAMRRQFDLNRLNLTILGDSKKVKNFKGLKAKLKRL